MQDVSIDHILKLSQLLTPKPIPRRSFDHDISPWNVDNLLTQTHQNLKRKETIKRYRQPRDYSSLKREPSIPKITQIGSTLVQPRYGGTVSLHENTIDQQRQQYSLDCRKKKSVLYLPELVKSKQVDAMRLALNGRKCHQIGGYANQYYMPSKTSLEEEPLHKSGSLDPKFQRLDSKMKSFHRRELIKGRRYKQKKKRTIEWA